MRFGKILEPQYRVVLLIPALLWSSPGSCLGIDDLFRVKTGITNGGCDNRRAVIESWLADTTTLVASVMAGNAACPTDVVFQKNLAAWFGIRTTRACAINGKDKKRYNTFVDTIQKLSTFLSTTPSVKPWLFCGSDWLVETEAVYDNNGVLVAGANARNYQPPNYNSLPASDPLKSFLIDMQQPGPGGVGWAKYAYYSSDIQDYNLEPSAERYLGTPPSWCNAPANDNHFALTLTRLTADAITLCDSAFTAVSEPFETIADGIASPESQMLNGALGDTSPRGLTLLHELIHFVADPDKTPDSGTKPTQCLALVADGRSIDASVNPDSYAFFAWSYHLSKHGTPNQYIWADGLAKPLP